MILNTHNGNLIIYNLLNFNRKSFLFFSKQQFQEDITNLFVSLTNTGIIEILFHCWWIQAHLFFLGRFFTNTIAEILALKYILQEDAFINNDTNYYLWC